MSDHQKWIEAATALMRNRHEMVLCPKCGMAYLQIEDEKVDEGHFDRHLRCPGCGAHEVVYARLDRHESSASNGTGGAS